MTDLALHETDNSIAVGQFMQLIKKGSIRPLRGGVTCRLVKDSEQKRLTQFAQVRKDSEQKWPYTQRHWTGPHAVSR